MSEVDFVASIDCQSAAALELQSEAAKGPNLECLGCRLCKRIFSDGRQSSAPQEHKMSIQDSSQGW